jgi:hypothetical protein
MLICFGAAWPVSIYKSYRSRSNGGKSVIFLYIVFTGYVAGVLHKGFNDYDQVIFLYMLNGLMVLIDICVYYRNKILALRTT